jgi:hypothetical protein
MREPGIHQFGKSPWVLLRKPADAHLTELAFFGSPCGLHKHPVQARVLQRSIGIFNKDAGGGPTGF